MRWKARTDLIWLCNHILDMPDVCEELNGVFISRLQQFPRPENNDMAEAYDRFDRKEGWIYRPVVRDESKVIGHFPDPNNVLFGKHRRRLFLDFRGSMKTHINVIAHTIQWILNYPDIGIAIIQSTKPKAVTFIKAIKSYFQYNEKLRALFPELCPQDKVADWGTTEEFICPGRTRGMTRIDPTVKALSLESKMAGIHMEVLKFSDVVEDDNSRKPEQCKETIKVFDSAKRILVSVRYWIDVEGTMWSFSDLYNEIIRREKNAQRVKHVYMVGNVPLLDKEEAKIAEKVTKKQMVEYHDYYVPQKEKREWIVYLNCVFKRAHPNPSYDYDDMVYLRRGKIHEAPLVFDAEGIPVSRWELKHPARDLMRDLENNAGEFNTQMMNCPTGGIDGVEEFPIEEKLIGDKMVTVLPATVPRNVFRQRVRVAYYDMAIDIADSTGKRSDYSCITVAAVDSNGRIYVVEILHGKWPHSELINLLMKMQVKYNPQRVLLEKGGAGNAFMGFLTREMELQKTWLNVVRLQRPGTNGKNRRISLALQPYWVNKHLLFLDDLGQPFEVLKKEAKEFPMQRNDDILDTLADLVHDKYSYGRQLVRGDMSPEELHAFNDAARDEQWVKSMTQQIKENAMDYMVRGPFQEGPSGPESIHSNYYRLTGNY